MKDGLGLGIQPFWFWNGDMNKDEIVRQVDEMADKGIRGFFIHPRQGMEIPYLSLEYFDRVKVAVNAAKIRGLEVWIYDEYPYPSGMSGGEVTLEHPEFLCKTINKVEGYAKDGETLKLFAPFGTVLSAKAYPIKDGVCDFTTYIDVKDYIGIGYKQEIFQLSGLTKYNKKRYFTGDPGKLLMWEAPAGEWKVYLFVEEVFKHFKYFENFVDPLNKDAVDYFIKTTHERYKKHLGHEFGKTIKGIFTDEVTAFPATRPWSPLLPGLVKERHDIDLIEYLPALWEDMGEITNQVRYAYWNTATETFIESYNKNIYNWCEDNNLLYVGEKPIMRSKELEYYHVPGIDAGHQKVGVEAQVIGPAYRANGKMVSSAAHFYKKPAALCEAFHSIGWGMTMQDMKWTFDWLALTGIDWFVVHGFFFTADGLKKHDAPPSAFYQMPWWKNANVISDYADFLGSFLRNTKRVVKILVVDPVTSTWTANPDKKKLLRAQFASMQQRMLEEQLDYYIIDPIDFAKGNVIKRDHDTVIRIGEEEFEMIVLPPMTNLEGDAIVKLKEYGDFGGKLCSLACIPYEKIDRIDAVGYMEELYQVSPRKIYECYMNETYHSTSNNGNILFASTICDMIAWLKEQLEVDWQIVPLDELGFKELPSMESITSEGKSVLFIMNLSSNNRKVKVRFKNGVWNEMNFSPYESRMLDETDSVNETKEEYELKLQGSIDRRLLGLNNLRIGMWNATFEDGQIAKVDSFPIIDQLEMAGIKKPIKQKDYFGCPKELDFVGDRVTYEYKFHIDKEFKLQEEIYLLMEPGSLLGCWEMFLNDYSIKEIDFSINPIYAPTNLTVSVSKYLKAGENKLIIQMNTKVSFDGIRNPLYLFGDFRVKKQEDTWIIHSMDKAGFLKDPVSSGIPFYAGTIVYDLEVNDLECMGESVVITIKDKEITDAVSLKVNDYLTPCCAWSPYEFKVPKEFIKHDSNKIEIMIDNTAIGLYEGQLFNHVKHSYESVE